MEINIEELLKINKQTNIVINDTYQCTLNELTGFSQYETDENCKSRMTCYIDVNVLNSNTGKNIIGRIYVNYNSDLICRYTGMMYMKETAKSRWISSFPIVKIEIKDS